MNNQGRENRIMSIETGKKYLSAWWLVLAALISLQSAGKHWLGYDISQQSLLIRGLLACLIYVLNVYALCNFDQSQKEDNTKFSLILLANFSLIFLVLSWPELFITLFFFAGALGIMIHKSPMFFIYFTTAQGLMFCLIPPSRYTFTETQLIELMAANLALMLGVVWMMLAPRLAEVIKHYRQAWVSLINSLTHR